MLSHPGIPYVILSDPERSRGGVEGSVFFSLHGGYGFLDFAAFRRFAQDDRICVKTTRMLSHPGIFFILPLRRPQ